jgi:flagellar motor component MotA
MSNLRDFALNFLVIMICLIVSAYLTSGSISAFAAAISLLISVVGGVACTILFRKLGA